MPRLRRLRAREHIFDFHLVRRNLGILDRGLRRRWALAPRRRAGGGRRRRLAGRRLARGRLGRIAGRARAPRTRGAPWRLRVGTSQLFVPPSRFFLRPRGCLRPAFSRRGGRIGPRHRDVSAASASSSRKGNHGITGRAAAIGPRVATSTHGVGGAQKARGNSSVSPLPGLPGNTGRPSGLDMRKVALEGRTAPSVRRRLRRRIGRSR